MTVNHSKKERWKIADRLQLGMLVISLCGFGALVWQISEATKAQIVNNLVSLNQQLYPCPKINEMLEDLERGNKLFNKNGGHYSEIEMDNLLGYFEMIGIIRSKGYLDTDIIFNMFGTDIEDLGDNKEIASYINDPQEARWPYLKSLLKNMKEYESHRK